MKTGVKIKAVGNVFGSLMACGPSSENVVVRFLSHTFLWRYSLKNHLPTICAGENTTATAIPVTILLREY